MREYFDAGLEKEPQDFTNLAKEKDPAKVIVAALTFFGTGSGIFMSYWYGSLYVVIEGWRQLGLSDSKIDPLLLSPNVRLLKKYRDGVFHFQRNYYDERFFNFIKSADLCSGCAIFILNSANISFEKSRRSHLKKNNPARRLPTLSASMALSSSKRVSLIKEIVRRLSAEEWPFIDLTLSQFSLPTADSWPGDQSTYVLKMLERASDPVLIELGQHVGFQFDEVGPQRVDPPFWQKGTLRLFISHLAVERDFAAGLQQALLQYGTSGFVAHNDIEPTSEWQAQIETALATSDALVALLHKGFHASNWADQEIGFAMGRGIPVFAVRFAYAPYGFIARFQAFNGNNKTAAALARELFDAYRTNKQTQRKMSEILIGLFEGSISFAKAKESIGYLELTSWEPSFSTRIRSAVKNNLQISESWGVPERVEALAKKWDLSSAPR